MSEQDSRRLAAIMFTDIEGYTALMQQDRELAIAARIEAAGHYVNRLNI